MEKFCSKCKIFKNKNEFNKHCRHRDGLQPICKFCQKESAKQYKLDHPEYDKKHSKQYYLDNKEKIIKKQTEYHNNKYKTDLGFKLLKNLRHRIYMALKQNSKSSRTNNLLGCSIKFLKSHLESQFIEGMTWNNQGQWHIDHIIPCASFNLSDPEQQRKCFNYSNLQPLWAIDNFKKSNKIGVYFE